jgi:UDP-N-acetyl-D-mannosaminuronic acid dehydrogenase
LGKKGMSIVLNLKLGEIGPKEIREKYTISVIGCQQIGLQFALAFAEAGFKVICTDEDQNLLQLLSKGKTPYFSREMKNRINSNVKRGRLTTQSEIKKAVSQSDIIIITTASKINIRNKLNFSKIERTCKKIGEVLNHGMLVVYGSISSIGYIENRIKEILENTSGLRMSEDFGLIYSPIQVNNQLPELFTDKKLVLAGLDKHSLNSATIIFQTIMKNEIKLVLGFKKLEAAVLFSMAKNDLDLAFANEIAIFCEKIGLDYFEITKILENCKPNNAQQIGIEKEEKSKFYMLIENAETNAVNAKLINLARKTNEGLARHSIKLTQKALRKCGKTLRRAKISIFGSIQPKTTVSELIRLIEKKGAKTSLYDPFRPKKNINDDKIRFKRSLNEIVEGTDCLIILNEHKKIDRLNFKKLSARMKMPAAIVDLTGALKPKKAEKEGFTYYGLGRGSKK